MKRMLTLIAGNILVLAVMLVIMEVVLQLAGVDTLVDMEEKEPGWERRHQAVLEKLQSGGLEFIDSFRTDGEGIFRANPEYFGRPDVNIAVNRDGFRGRPFEYADTPRTKVLLVGDSFVWGSAADPLTNCFADLLEGAGYYVYNAGIPGTDPQQYALVAGKYTAALKPDVVAVCVYMGNDVTTKPLVVQPNKRLHYVTNAGWLRGTDDSGRCFEDEQDVIAYLKRKTGYCPTILDWIRFKTVTGRILSGTFARDRRSLFTPDKQWARDALQRIQDVCAANKTPFLLFLIPSVNADARPDTSIAGNLHLFEGFKCFYPDGLTKADYREGRDTHLNNNGHRKYADFMLAVLEREGLARARDSK